MSAANVLAVARNASLGETMASVARGLTPSQFAAAVTLGLANHTLVVLTYLEVPWIHANVTLVVALVAVLAFVVVANRRAHRLAAWTLLLPAYALLGAIVVAEPGLRHYVLTDQIMSHALAFAIFGADRLVAEGRGRRMTYVVAAVTGVATGGLILALVLHLWPDSFAATDAWREERSLPHFLDLYAAHLMLHWLLFGGAVVLLYAERRLAEQALRRLHAARLERLARSRQIVESRLQLMQARIEPHFLFSTLERVKRLYASEPEWAECMLDELGAFLRAAMPQMRESDSTLGREVELVRAYVAILGIHARNRLDCVIEVASELADAPLPSMMLLPLVDQSVARALGSSSEAVRIRIRASQEALRLRVVIGSTAAAPAKFDEAAIAAIEERLGVLYRGRASVAQSAQASGEAECVLEIPHERNRRRL